MTKPKDLQIAETDAKNLSVILTMFDTMLERDKSLEDRQLSNILVDKIKEIKATIAYFGYCRIGDICELIRQTKR